MCLWECVLVCVYCLARGRRAWQKQISIVSTGFAMLIPDSFPFSQYESNPTTSPPCLVRLGATCRQSAGQMDGLPSKLAPSSWARTQFECKTKRNDEAEDELLQGGTGHDDVGGRGCPGWGCKRATFSLSNTCAVHYLWYNLLLYERREKRTSRQIPLAAKPIDPNPLDPNPLDPKPARPTLGPSLCLRTSDCI